MIVYDDLPGIRGEVKYLESADDIPEFVEFIRQNKNGLAFDTETTGLDVYNNGFRLRTAQFGNHREAYVIPVEYNPANQALVVQCLSRLDNLVMHNASFDIRVLSQCLGMDREKLWAKTTDTRIIAHLVEPRGREEGGTGHSLEQLCRAYVSADYADHGKTAMAELARECHTPKADIWARVNTEHPTFVRYSGGDVIVTARLLSILAPALPGRTERLVGPEHQLARVCSEMERKGVRLDREYTERLSSELQVQQDDWEQEGAALGCENINSPDQQVAAFRARGVKINKLTPTGKPSVDKQLLDELVANGDKLAEAIQSGKRVRKRRTTWVDRFLSDADPNYRVHPSINPLRARTARMSVSTVPAQTLPSDDSQIRRCFLADPGSVPVSVDFKAQELRVLAAFSGDETMIDAFAHDKDLHLMTARAAFGEHITKDSPERHQAKTANFGKVYGGGAQTLAEQSGMDVPTAKRVLKAFSNQYPRVEEYSNRLMAEAKGAGRVTTPTGRVLPVDKARAYSALNYVVQSTSRDITAAALLRLDRAGWTPHMMLPIHDEVLLSVPADLVKQAVEEVQALMRQTFLGVLIDTEAKVGISSWGSLYGADI